MSLRNEQCNKVCRILDDVLANRPTERDSLVTAVRKAFGALETEPKWIPCSERLPGKDGDYYVTTHNGQIARYIFIKGVSEEYWMRCAVAWMPLPTPYRKDGD